MNTLIKQTTKQAFAKVNFAKFALAMLTTAMLTACGGSDSSSTQQTDAQKTTDTAAGVAVAYKVLHMGGSFNVGTHSSDADGNIIKLEKVVTNQADYATELTKAALYNDTTPKSVDFTSNNVLVVTKGSGRGTNYEVTKVDKAYDTGDAVTVEINHVSKTIDIGEYCTDNTAIQIPYIFVAVATKKPIKVKRVYSQVKSDLPCSQSDYKP